VATEFNETNFHLSAAEDRRLTADDCGQLPRRKLSAVFDLQSAL